MYSNRCCYCATGTATDNDTAAQLYYSQLLLLSLLSPLLFSSLLFSPLLFSSLLLLYEYLLVM